MPYVTAYEITRETIPLWIPVLFVIFGLFGVIFHWFTRDAGPLGMPFRCLTYLFACVWLFFTIVYFHDRRHDVQNYRTGKYNTVEGLVENHSLKGKTECFSVHAVTLCQGTANQVGWDPPFRLGLYGWRVGLPQNGLPVRVAYTHEPIPFENGYAPPKILRLEIARGSR